MEGTEVTEEETEVTEEGRKTFVLLIWKEVTEVKEGVLIYESTIGRQT